MNSVEALNVKLNEFNINLVWEEYLVIYHLCSANVKLQVLLITCGIRNKLIHYNQYYVHSIINYTNNVYIKMKEKFKFICKYLFKRSKKWFCFSFKIFI